MSGESTTVFVECVSCAQYGELFDHDVDDRQAMKEAASRGWTVAGYRNAKHTRCPDCRRRKRKDTKAADEGRLGRRAGRYQMKPRA